MGSQWGSWGEEVQIWEYKCGEGTSVEVKWVQEWGVGGDLWGRRYKSGSISVGRGTSVEVEGRECKCGERVQIGCISVWWDASVEWRGGRIIVLGVVMPDYKNG